MSMLDRAFSVIDRWRNLYQSKIKQVEELTATVKFLKLRVGHYKNRAEHYHSRFAEVIRKNNDLRRRLAKLEVPQVMIQVDALRALFGQRPASEVYAAQSELELLRVIRKSQGEGITKLRQQLAEACKERDAASVRNEGLRKQLFGVQEDNERVKIELRDAREATNAGAIRYCDVCKERDAWRQEALNLEVSLHGLGLCSCRVVYSNPVEAMKANPRLSMMLDEDLDRRHFLNQDVIRRSNSRNVDNQKAYEAPNCPSS